MGYITQSGLANGEYYLVETKTADGYNLLKSPVKVQLNVQYATKWSKEMYGQLILIQVLRH